MKKFSTEEITNIISNETNIWEQFKQNMKRWEKKTRSIWNQYKTRTILGK